MDLLEKYIQDRNEHSLESLLDLLTHFAHDLGPDFEPYFLRSLKLLMGLVADDSIAVVEWAFNCFAYLFKYLSRLLTTDLRPTYDFLAPLLGKQHQKKHVLRFTAESLSFLIRKCTGEPLKLIINHIVNDVVAADSYEYFTAVVQLLGDSVLSSGNHLHSRTQSIISTLLESSTKFPAEKQLYLSSFVEGIFAHILHHARKETASPLYEVGFQFIDANVESKKNVLISIRLLYVLGGLRQGSRVSDWSAIYKRATALAQQLSDSETEKLSAIELVATIMGNSEYQDSAVWHSKLLGAFAEHTEPNDILSLCVVVLKTSKKAFQDFLRPYLEQVVKNHSASDEQIAFALLQMVDEGVASDQGIQFSVPLAIDSKSAFAKAIWSRVEQNTKQIKDLAELYWCLNVLASCISVDAGRIKKTIPKVVTALLKNDEVTLLRSATVGKALALHAKSEAADRIISSAVIEQLPVLRQSKTFLQGFHKCLERKDFTDSETIIKVLSESLTSADSEVRAIALKCIKVVNASSSAETLLDMCSLIESIPVDISNTRNLTMHIRNLGVNYSTTGSDFTADLAIPCYLVGLLTVRFKPAWEAATDALEKITSKSEGTVWTLVHNWLKETPTPTISLERADFEFHENEFEKASTVRCSNLNKVSDISASTFDFENNAAGALQNFVYDSVDPGTPFPFYRTRALEVLLKIPRVAEKHSRLLVPYLLLEDEEDLMNEEEEQHENDGEKWTQQDRTLLLEVFTHFVNPRTLYKSEEVYQRLLYLLGNRIVNIQKLALKCIITYKDSTVRKYSDNLFNLLDDTQFKDELTTFVQSTTEDAEDEKGLHKDDRQAVLPLVIRIIFGRAQVARTGGVKQGRRFAVIQSLNSVEPEFLRLFLTLTTQRLECDGFLEEDDNEFTISDMPMMENSNAEILCRRQLGFVSMLEEVLKILRAHVQPGVDIVMEAILYCLFTTASLESEDASPYVAKSIKSIRTTSIKCLSLLFECLPSVQWSRYFDLVYKSAVAPRIDTFASDNVSQPSALMNMLVILTTRQDLITLFSYNDLAIPKALFACLNYENVKDSVVEQVVDAMQNILTNGDAIPELALTCSRMVLDRLPFLLDRESPPVLWEKESSVLVTLLERFKVDDSVREKLLTVSLAALEKPSGQVRLPVKAVILEALKSLLLDERASEDEIVGVFKRIAGLFKQFADRQVRINLSKLYQAFGQRVSSLQRVGDLVVELNSYSTRRIDMPDFDRRLAAFAAINEDIYASLNDQEWLPLLYNMLFFSKDPEELALRNNASYSLRRFIDAIAVRTTEEEAMPLVQQLQDILLPAVKLNVRDSNEIFRVEYIGILAHIVSNSKWYHGLDDMKPLLYEGDEEANFFNNVMHIQEHRRQRAVRRLATFAVDGQLKDTSIAHYLLPIVEHFVIESSTSESSHNLSAESVTTIGALTRSVTYNQYRAITKRYVSYLNRVEKLKTAIKLIDVCADSLLFSKEEESDDKKCALATTLPKTERLSVFIVDDLVPSMQESLKTKKQDDEEETLTTRIPLAIPIVKFIKCLPGDLIEVKLPGVLTGFCQILRAKSQPLRDQIRKSLGRIAKILGAKYLVFIIREMRAALRRGAQLHVLGYSVHSLLVELKEAGLQPGDLDPCSEIVSEVIMEDIFGVTGSDKDQEDYKSKMKEVKAQKSFDSGQILATNVSLSVFGNLIEPVKAILLYEKLTLQIERKVEELLRRLAHGLYHNEEASDRRVLVMCHELYQMVEKAKQDEAKRQKELELNRVDAHKKEIESQYLVQLDSRHWDEQITVVYLKNLHVLVRFVIEALRVVLGRNEQQLMTVENVSGFIPMLEEGLSDSFEDVQIASLRLLTLIIRLPLKDMVEKLKSYGRQTLALIRSSPTTNTELCQASLRFLAALIKHKQEFVMKDNGVTYVLERIKPDLEEPDRQGITFTFIKAVLYRKIVLPEVYDVMDRVAEVMVTNQSKVTRDTCRSAYYQFLTEYPQGKGRLNKQLKFLVSNLEYPAYAGRLSVLEMIHLLVTKVNSEHIKAITTTFFAALTLVLINDEVSECREHAAQVLREIMRASEPQQRQYMKDYMISWIRNPEQPLLIRGGLQVAGIYLTETKEQDEKQLLEVMESRISQILESSKADSGDDVTWELVYFALQAIDKIAQVYPDRAFSKQYNNLWDQVEGTLLYPHSWVRLVSARLMGRLYGQKNTYQGDFASAAYKYVRQLRATSISEELGVQIVKNLVYIGRQWEESGFKMDQKMNDAEEEAEAEEEEGNDEEASKRAGSEHGLDWVVSRVSSILRNETSASKTACIQFLASVVQIVSLERLHDLSEDIIMALFPFSVSDDDRFKDLKDFCIQALGLVESKMGTTEYYKVYAKVQEKISQRRIERRTKRALQAVVEPELYAKKKLKKNLHKREKRRHVKDANGYYHR
uniref:ARAD1D17996p n=1 Tax=Blastobotrys adeninivorans TaxID=409370 RepID=A0A060TAD6_BLAAD